MNVGDYVRFNHTSLELSGDLYGMIVSKDILNVRVITTAGDIYTVNNNDINVITREEFIKRFGGMDATTIEDKYNEKVNRHYGGSKKKSRTPKKKKSKRKISKRKKSKRKKTKRRIN